ncbi:PREDICTED: mucin-6-like [Branchiostoma belcheri]|uniref:Mucin-6-like n=1 Tax=Branchiostoma belcheri TaxID=7741 RepID=A0A6P5APL0_BRABE|nr:PREDICTED: mucin-6-like [Branchiostoma belcheri]
MVLNNGECIRAIDCPCYYPPHEKFYKFGATFAKDECTTCACTKGGIECDMDCNISPEDCQEGEVFENVPGKCCGCFPSTCTNGMEYQSICACHRTCTNLTATCDMDTCQPGCACPDDMVFNGLECVEPTQCTCEYEGKSYSPGEIWVPGECTMCKCMDDHTPSCGEYCPITQCY